jgi:hypothetical protein
MILLSAFGDRSVAAAFFRSGQHHREIIVRLLQTVATARR